MMYGNPSLGMFLGGYANSVKKFKTLQGGFDDGIRLNNPVMDEGKYTWFSIARYSGDMSSRGRIFIGYADGTLNFFTGFWAGNSGMAYHGDDIGFVTAGTDRHGSDWFVWMDQGSRIRSNSADISTKRRGNPFPQMSINWGDVWENSEWQIAEIILFDYAMQTSQIIEIENYLGSKYGIRGYESQGRMESTT